MLSRVSERKMLSVRGLLLLAWLILIASLFWDPYSASLTSADNALSPFRITSNTVLIQGRPHVVTPYPLGARIFWTMVVAIVPLYLMVFGHEAWRRVCPLSMASQIPGYLGLRRYRNGFDRRIGRMRRSLVLVESQSWLARNSWYVQFGLLFAGVNMRLLIINTDRQALGIALLAVIAAAMLTGFLWGGKTWCNYLCPANVVQKIYTEPSGILESTPHFSRPTLPQSMCRKPADKGDVSACVGCMANCGDIDLQRSYWNGVLNPQRRNVYYMFFGLIIAFYTYYYLYAGNWDYYFSGIWTHEDGVRHKLLQPGFFFFGHTVAIPKIIAAPLTLAVACLMSLALGRGLEALYRGFRLRQQTSEENAEQVLVHHCLSVSAWLSINAFYIFGGRPNILLLPGFGTRLLDLAILALTTLWLFRALQHSPMRYQQESMASSLLTELKKFKVNVGRFLGGRALEHLKANEIYLLSNALADFSHQQKLDAYRAILDEAVTRGATTSSSAVKLLEDFRHQMKITEEEHTRLIEDLGLVNIEDDAAISAGEKAASLNYYKNILGGIIAERLDGGTAVEDLVKAPDIRSAIDVLRKSLLITEAEHLAIVEDLSQVPLAGCGLDEVLDDLLQHRSIRLCIEGVRISNPLGSTLARLLLEALDARQQAFQIQALSILRNRGPRLDMQHHAEDLASLGGHDLDVILRQVVPAAPNLRWRDALDPKILAILSRRDSADDPNPFLDKERRTHSKATLASMNVDRILSELLALGDPLIRALGLAVTLYMNPSLARTAAERMMVDGTIIDHQLLVTTIEHIIALAEETTSASPHLVLRATVSVHGLPDENVAVDKDIISIGRAVDNDIIVPDPKVSSYQLAIRLSSKEAQLIRLDDGDVFVDGRFLQQNSTPLEKDSLIALNESGNAGSKIKVTWDGADQVESGQFGYPIFRLAMLAQTDSFGHLPIEALADIAGQASAEHWTHGTAIESSLAQGRYFLVHLGRVRIFDVAGKSPEILLGAGDIFSSAADGLRAEVISEFAVVLHLPSGPEVRAAAMHQSGLAFRQPEKAVAEQVFHARAV